jgi:hypothetical protein
VWQARFAWQQAAGLEPAGLGEGLAVTKMPGPRVSHPPD